MSIYPVSWFTTIITCLCYMPFIHVKTPTPKTCQDILVFNSNPKSLFIKYLDPFEHLLHLLRLHGGHFRRLLSLDMESRTGFIVRLPDLLCPVGKFLIFIAQAYINLYLLQETNILIKLLHFVFWG